MKKGSPFTAEGGSFKQAMNINFVIWPMGERLE